MPRNHTTFVRNNFSSDARFKSYFSCASCANRSVLQFHDYTTSQNHHSFSVQRFKRIYRAILAKGSLTNSAKQRLLIAWLLIFARVRFEAARRWWQPGLHSPLERIKDNRVKLARGSTMFGASCSSTRSILITVASAFSRICPGLA